MDRLLRATEIGDLMLRGGPYVSRGAILREPAGQPAYQTVRMVPPSAIIVSPVM